MGVGVMIGMSRISEVQLSSSDVEVKKNLEVSNNVTSQERMYCLS